MKDAAKNVKKFRKGKSTIKEDKPADSGFFFSRPAALNSIDHD